ncbi:MAG: dipeptidase [Bacteroidales bacterium]|nr:dipeptidase [Bacteroidales bacterium]
MKPELKLILFLFFSLLVLNSSTAQKSNSLEAKAARIHQSAFTVDSHTDTPLNFLNKSYDISKDNSKTISRSCVDFPRMRAGGLDAAFFAVFIGQGPRTAEGNAKAKAKAETIFDSIYATVTRNNDISGIATSQAEAMKLVKQKKSVVFIGVENGYPIGNDLSNVKHFYNRGARYITLCHTKNNDICTSSTDTANKTGLSDFGKQVVREMNRLGMMVDVSHVSDQSFYDILKLSKAPVLASHSCARALCDNPRNLTDDMLRALAANNGVVQMCILSDYVKKPLPNPVRDSLRQSIRKKYHNFQDLTDEQWEIAITEFHSFDDKFPQQLATVQDVINHIDHMVKIAGIDHVGIGTDFDGGGGVDGCKDVSQMGNITLELVKRGYCEKDIEKIWGGNLMRVLRDVEKGSGS